MNEILSWVGRIILVVFFFTAGFTFPYLSRVMGIHGFPPTILGLVFLAGMILQAATMILYKK